MSFQAYLDNIKVKTGKTPADLKKLADKKGLLKPGVKAGEILKGSKKISVWATGIQWLYGQCLKMKARSI